MSLVIVKRRRCNGSLACRPTKEGQATPLPLIGCRSVSTDSYDAMQPEVELKAVEAACYNYSAHTKHLMDSSVDRVGPFCCSRLTTDQSKLARAHTTYGFHALLLLCYKLVRIALRPASSVIVKVASSEYTKRRNRKKKGGRPRSARSKYTYERL